MSGVAYILVVICISQFPCSGESVYFAGQPKSFEDCLKLAKGDDAHRAFCVPQRANDLLIIEERTR